MSSTPSAYDLRWKQFRLTELLKGLHEYAEKTYQGDEVEYAGYKPAKDRAILLRKSLSTSKPKSLESSAASSNTFFKDIAGNLGDFLSGIKLIGSHPSICLAGFNCQGIGTTCLCRHFMMCSWGYKCKNNECGLAHGSK